LSIINALPPDRDLIDNFDPKAFERNDFSGMVRQQPDRVQSQIAQNLGADPVLVLELTLTGLPLVVQELTVVRHHASFAL